MSDTQITELAGRHYLISQLLAGGVEVASPVRDRGIDLIAYMDRVDDQPEFLACPIQLKANEEARFGVEKKYEKTRNLLMVYAWKVSTTAPELYALTYHEVVELLEGRGHTRTASWTKVGGGYSLKVNDAWREILSSFRMKPEDWQPAILSVCRTGRTLSKKLTTAEA
jgi:hypothetical protein